MIKRVQAAFALAAILCVWRLAGMAGAPPVVMEDVSRLGGVDFVLRNGAAGEWRQIETMVAGAVAFDADGDRRTDLFFVNGASGPNLRKELPGDGNRLYRNRGDGTFADVTAASGLTGDGFGIGARRRISITTVTRICSLPESDGTSYTGTAVMGRLKTRRPRPGWRAAKDGPFRQDGLTMTPTGISIFSW